MDKQREIKFCRECGSKMFKSSSGPEVIKIWRPDSCGGSSHRLDSPFHEESGERNNATIFTCPKWKKYWIFYNRHDKVVVYDNDLYRLWIMEKYK